jgi:hypothetical protein
MVIMQCGRGGGLDRSDKTATGITSTVKEREGEEDKDAGARTGKNLLLMLEVYSMTALGC